MNKNRQMMKESFLKKKLLIESIFQKIKMIKKSLDMNLIKMILKKIKIRVYLNQIITIFKI